MKIAVLSSRYPTTDNPYSHMFVHTRNKEYVMKGHQVTVLVPSTKPEQYEIDGVVVIKGSVQSFLPLLDETEGVMIHLLFHRFNRETDASVLYDYIQTHNIPCLFYIHGVECQKIWRSRRDDIKLTAPMSIARFIYRDFYLINKMRKTLKRFCIENSRSAFVTPSQWMSKESVASTDVDTSAKTVIIPNGIDTERFKYREQWENRHKLLSIRPLYAKGKYANDLLIEASRHLENSQITVNLFGDGPEKDIIREQVAKLNNFNLNVGFLQPSDIANIHQNFGMYGAVTRMDAQGVSMCEAMASGLPVISFNTCAIPEFIEHGVTGMLASCYNVNEFVDYCRDISTDKNKYISIAESARNFIEAIDIKSTTEKELKLLNSL